MKLHLMGAVTGDISGSWYEFRDFKARPETLILPRDFFTDDTVLTIAVAHGMIAGFRQIDRSQLAQSPEAQKIVRGEITRALWQFAQRYPDAGYGRTFYRWFRNAARGRRAKPYNSWGNGSAMRASFPGWAAASLEDALLLGRLSAEVTHDHPEGIKGAQAIAAAIFLLRSGASKAEVREYLSQLYDLDFTMDEIRPTYQFEVSCQKSVPQAINAFLEAEDFEDTLKTALSIGGDSDTLATMAGSIAEACYPIPEDLKGRAWEKLTPDLQAELTAVNQYLNQ
jgi:ADP-ribosylglycohydrolase